jgi:hypothetical protein
MFTDMVAECIRGMLPEPDTLRKRFDFAVTKKLGSFRQPLAFRVQDSKINPRSDHLFWAALLLRDRERIDLALSIIATEAAERNASGPDGRLQETEALVSGLIDTFFQQISDIAMRRGIRRELGRIIPEWIRDSGRNAE